MTRTSPAPSHRVWITGASSGIGRATALALVRTGHHVVATARSTAALEALREEATDMPGTLDVRACNVTRSEETQGCANWIQAHLGGLDVLIPNAGIGHFDPLKHADLEEWKAMVDVNVQGVLNTLHAALPLLLASRGHVINIGSLAARQVFPNSGVYCATKHAVLALSESLRLEFRDELAVTTINPGAVDTPFIERTSNEALRASYRPQFSEGMAPEFVADAIVFAVESGGRGVVSELTLRPDRRG